MGTRDKHWGSKPQDMYDEKVFVYILKPLT